MSKLDELAQYEDIAFTESKEIEKTEKTHCGKTWSEPVTEEMRQTGPKLKQNGPDWAKARRFGGTHAYIACNTGYDVSARLQWQVDTNRVQAPAPSMEKLKLFSLGHGTESWIADVYSAVMNKELEQTGLHYHPKYDWATLSPDRMVGLECKTLTDKPRMVDDEGVPITKQAHVVQTIFSMAVLDVTHYDLAYGWRSYEHPRPEYTADVCCVRVYRTFDLAKSVMSRCKSYAESVIEDYNRPSDKLCPAAGFRLEGYVSYQPLFRVRFTPKPEVTRFTKVKLVQKNISDVKFN